MRLSGTSMASPHVAGLVACILSTSQVGERPDVEVLPPDDDTPSTVFDCCGRFGSSSVPPPADSAPSPSGEFGKVKDDASLREVLNEKFLKDIGVTGPYNETCLGFLSYLSKDELMAILDSLQVRTLIKGR